MYQKLFDLKLKIAKLVVCSNNITEISGDYRKYLERLKEKEIRKNASYGFIYVLIYWTVFAILSFVKTVTAIPETAYDILFFTNFAVWAGSFSINLIKSYRIHEKYDAENMETLFRVARLGTTMLAFYSSLERRYNRRYNELSEESKQEYEMFLKEHQEQFEELNNMNYDLEEIRNVILENVHEDDNNIMDNSPYCEQATKEYTDYVTGLMTDYLLEEKAAELINLEEVKENGIKKIL